MKFRKEKRQFIQIKMLVVQKQFQGHGHMRALISNAFELADKRVCRVSSPRMRNSKKISMFIWGWSLSTRER